MPILRRAKTFYVLSTAGQKRSERQANIMSKESSEMGPKSSAEPKLRTIHVDYLARVEGEGSFHIKTKGNDVEEVHLKIFEPPRFFEGFLSGRDFSEAPDITARICGICPVAYQTSSINAMEEALHVDIPDYIHQMRRLIYCGEWIESHALHVYMLHAPDFLGYQDSLAMAKDHPEAVKRGLRLKKAGNELLRVLGGREIHPINVKVGGFYQLPKKAELLALRDMFKQALDDAHETVSWVSQFTFPQLERSYECVSMSHPDEYPMARGTLTSTSGLTIQARDWETYFEEYHLPRSTSLYSRLKPDTTYFLGPIARYNLNREKLSPIVKEVVRSIGFEACCSNPFRSIIVRALEILYSCDEVLRLIDLYDAEKRPPSVPMTGRAGRGCGLSEAPRGVLYHRYTLDDHGRIQSAKIAAPTSQNQKVIEEDLFEFAKQNLALSDEDLTWRCEQAIRNYDPCISCSTHFLRLERVRG
jgi:sulfhydrogenase subunit alpha